MCLLNLASLIVIIIYFLGEGLIVIFAYEVEQNFFEEMNVTNSQYSIKLQFG